MKHFSLLFFVVLFVLSACSPVEMGRRVAGTSLESLEDEKEGRYSRVFGGSVPENYAAALDFLKEEQIYVYLQNQEQGFIVGMYFHRMFPRCIDTTEVGFFFDEAGKNQTRIAVVSLNYPLAKHVSDLLFAELDETP